MVQRSALEAERRPFVLRTRQARMSWVLLLDSCRESSQKEKAREPSKRERPSCVVTTLKASFLVSVLKVISVVQREMFENG